MTQGRADDGLDHCGNREQSGDWSCRGHGENGWMGQVRPTCTEHLNSYSILFFEKAAS